MSYKKLQNFRMIFKRPDFEYVSEIRKIDEIEKIIMFNLRMPDGREASYVVILERYFQNLNFFYESVMGHNIPDINEGYHMIKNILVRCITFFSEKDPKQIIMRSSISPGYCKKFSATFLFGLSLLLRGIRIAFDPGIVSRTNIDRNQLVRYILDSREGLGRRFIFNTKGRHAFVNKITTLSNDQVIVTERLLVKPGNQVRSFNGWIDLGERGTLVRILGEHRTLGKDKIHFLYKVNEHVEYESQLQTSPDKVAFSAV